MGPPLARMEHELRAGFNGGAGTSHGVPNSMRDSMLPYGIQAGSRDLVGMWAPNEGCNAGLRVGIGLHVGVASKSCLSFSAIGPASVSVDDRPEIWR